MPSPAEIAAYIGAAAWIPQLLRLLHQATTKPRVTILPARRPQLGHTTFGPIFNVDLALSADNRDVLITDLVVTVCHEDGDAHEFRWQGLTQTFSRAVDRTGLAVGEYNREQAALGLKLRTASVEERFVRFQEVVFVDKAHSLTQKAVQHEAFLQTSRGEHYSADELLKSEPVHELISFYKQAFCWKPGRYTVIFRIGSPHKPIVSNDKFSFTLTPDAVENLRKNIDNIDPAVENEARVRESGYTAHDLIWRWEAPTLTRGDHGQ